METIEVEINLKLELASEVILSKSLSSLVRYVPRIVFVCSCFEKKVGLGANSFVTLNTDIHSGPIWNTG